MALAQRVAKSNADRSSGQALARVAAEIDADRETLKRLMAELGVRGLPLKNAGAWGMERLARLKPNGRASGAGSEFHRMHELERRQTSSLGGSTLRAGRGIARRPRSTRRASSQPA